MTSDLRKTEKKVSISSVGEVTSAMDVSEKKDREHMDRHNPPQRENVENAVSTPKIVKDGKAEKKDKKSKVV